MLYSDLHQLTFDYKNASLVIDDVLCCLSKADGQMPRNIGEIFGVCCDFKSKELPSGKDWRWNQVKGRKKVLLPKSQLIGEFFQLKPRLISERSSVDHSSMELWRINILQKNSSEVIFRILWNQQRDIIAIEDFVFARISC